MLAAKGSCSTIRGDGVANEKLFSRARGLDFWRELRTFGGVWAGAGAGAGADAGDGESVGVLDRKEACGGIGALREGMNSVDFAAARRAEYSLIDALEGMWYSTVFDSRCDVLFGKER